MGTVIPRKLGDGSTRYQAQLLIKRSGKIVHREGRTFERRQAAAAWLEKRETELAKPGALDRLKEQDPPLALVIDRYVDEFDQRDWPDKGPSPASDQVVRHRQQKLLQNWQRGYRCIR